MRSPIRLARPTLGRRRAAVLIVAATALATGGMLRAGPLAASPAASASGGVVDLGTATSFAVLAGSTVTNTGPSVVSGDLGVSPKTAVTGFPPGTVVNGTIHAGDATAAGAQADLTTAYKDARDRAPTALVVGDLGGQTFVAGVYRATGPLALTGTVTLDAQGVSSSVFIFQAPSTTLTTASNSTVHLINGADPCNVFWQVGSSATLGTHTTFVGSILALASTTVTTGTTVDGRVLARNAAVTLDTNMITRPTCTGSTSTPSPTATGTPSPTATSTPSPTATSTPGPTATGTPVGTPRATATPRATPVPTATPRPGSGGPGSGGPGSGGPGSGGPGSGGPGSGGPGSGGPGSGGPGSGGPGSGGPGSGGPGSGGPGSGGPGSGGPGSGGPGSGGPGSGGPGSGVTRSPNGTPAATTVGGLSNGTPPTGGTVSTPGTGTSDPRLTGGLLLVAVGSLLAAVAGRRRRQR